MTASPSSVLTVRIPTALKERLNHLSEQTERPVGFYVKKMIEQNLDEIEHAYELQARAQAVRESKARTYTTDELRAELGL